MPFTRDGKWETPTDKEIDAFKQVLEDNDRIINPTPAMITAMQQAATTSLEKVATTGPTTNDIFQAIARIKGEVDIVIPVYGGLQVLKKCVESVEALTHWNYNLIFVDDASKDPATVEYLKTLQVNSRRPFHTLFNKQNRGFAATINRGISYGKAPYVCVLNSDVIVTEGWLTRLLVALESNERNCIVNPVTNNTAMINVSMYAGRSYLDMDSALTKQSQVRYPEVMPTGFCFMFRRDLYNEIGPFDEAYGSYGEETDFWYRAIKATDEDGVLKGYRAVLADNCYVFHERGTSFSQLGESEHIQQRRSGGERFNQCHPGFAEWQGGFDLNGALGGLRNKIPERAFEKGYKGQIAWAVKSTGPSGGMFFIADIANHLIEQGYDVKVCLVPDETEDSKGNEIKHNMLGSLHTQPILFKSRQEFVDTFEVRCFKEGILLSAVTELTAMCYKVMENNNKIRVFNHVQSWDVDLAESLGCEASVLDEVRAAYKAVPNISTSNWVSEEIEAIGGEVISTRCPGVNTDLFHDRDRSKGDERLTVAVLLLENYPFKGYDRGVQFCKELIKQSGKHDIRVLGIGPDALPDVPGVTAMGGISQSKMAELLGQEVDILVDPATVHSYGMPGVEALVSGCHFVCWDNKGVHEYAQEFPERLTILDDEDPVEEAVAECLAIKPVRAAFDVPARITRANVIDKFETFIFGEELQHETRIEVISPHMRKHGGPTTLITTANLLSNAGNDVSLSMIYDDFNPEVISGIWKDIPLRSKGWEKVPEGSEVVIINSDNPFARQIMHENPGPKYIMLKLSHNERFKAHEADNLMLPWDHIITSTNHLREKCLEPTEGWEYGAWGKDKVTTVGWYHYGHPVFDRNPEVRVYGTAETGFTIGTLIHDHPLKGTMGAIHIIEALRKKYEAQVAAVGVGEGRAKLSPHMQYYRKLNRPDMANVIQQLDVWLGASYTEGLGRMSLEAMSAGTAVVTTDTGAEFLRHGENCLLYDAGDFQRGGELVDSIVNNKDLFLKLVENGYATAVEHSNPKPYQDNLMKVIREVTK